MVLLIIRRMIALAALVALTACGGVAATDGGGAASGSAIGASGGGTLRVVATTSVIADLATNVGGDRVDVRALLPAGADPHTYTPAPTDVQAVAEAQILFENGLGLDAWLDELTRNAGGERPVVVVSDGLTPIAGGHHDDAHAEEAAGDDHADDASDPHMWFDVQNAIGYVERIRDGLKQVDPAGAATYEANAAAYIDQLRQLDAEITQQVAQIPEARRKLVTNHDTLGYFARRYGFEVVGSVFENVSTEQEPSPQQIAALVQQIRAQQLPAIFTENTVSSRLAEQVASETGVKVVSSLYTDALGEPGSPGDTYIRMMRYNTQQIVDALK